MRTMRVLGRSARQTIPALAAALLIPFAAAATERPASISHDLCDYASSKPALIQTRLNALFLSLAFTGLPPEQCEGFVNSLVKSCVQLVTLATQCSVNINAAIGMNACVEAAPIPPTQCVPPERSPVAIGVTFGRFGDLNCDTLTDKAERASCKKTAKQNLKETQATAQQPVQLIGVNACNSSFALLMTERCLEGVPPP